VACLSEPAFAEFYRRTARALWAYVYRTTSNASDADDIVQDAFHRLLRTDVPTTDEDELRRYLFRIAGNLMTDRWRRAQRERSWLERLKPDPGVAADTPAMDMSRTFALLKPRERALLWLAYVEQESHEEIADSLGVARGSVKVLLSRARARLRDVLVKRGLVPWAGSGATLPEQDAARAAGR
jgi:RNA polymerase sigma-70 factor (ECF subfamily)